MAVRYLHQNLFSRIFVLALAGSATISSLCASAGDNPMPQLIHLFAEDRGNLERFYNLNGNQLDHNRFQQFYQEWQQRLTEVDFPTLSQEGKIDYLLLKNLLGFSERKLEYNKERLEEVSRYLPFAPLIITLVDNRRQSVPMKAREAATTLAAIAEEVDASATKLKDMHERRPLRSIQVDRALRELKTLRFQLNEWQRFYKGYDPSFGWWTDTPYRKVNSALDAYQKFFDDVTGGEDEVIGDPIGRKALLDALESEFIPYTPEELIAIAEREYAWCEKEMKLAAADMGLEDDWQQALAQVKDRHVDPGKQPVLIKQLAEEAVDFLKQRELVTIPRICHETWRMEMMTPERQKVNPYFTGGEVISVSFPTDSMEHDDKLMSLRGNNRHFCMATVHHELIPGHHLQIYMAKRYRPYREIFRTPFLVEGWALYWEMLLWDLNFHKKDPHDRMGMLFWRTHRCARIIFSLKFHLGQMTASEAIDFLIKNVGHERRNATAEVRRSVQGGYEPLYQAAYMLGGLQFRALRKELVDSGILTDKQFHDRILLENSIPIELIRASLTDTPLTEDFRSQWKFYEALRAEE